MKYNSKILLSVIICLISFSACKKIANKFYPNGNPVTLSASTTTVSPNPSDSASTVLILNWNNPKYSTDSSHQKFIIEIDSSGRNFSHEVTFEVDGPLSYSFTGSQLNNLLANFGFTAGKPFNVDIRVTSSYANNNEQYKSNVVTIAMTPYIVPVTLSSSSSGTLVLQISNATDTA
ncbi:MAG TPA: SusE domain-containing protein, partial [Hanamia sp.]|nr:SusE domain-containing protein [Hanamia sp.]